MKKILSMLILTGIFMLLPMQTAAQDKIPKTNYTALVNTSRSMMGAIETAEELMLSDPNGFGEFQVVFCGRSIDEITDSKTIGPILNRIKSSPVKVIACGFSLDTFKVDRNAIPMGIHTVENGILYQLQLLKKGYLSLEL